MNPRPECHYAAKKGKKSGTDENIASLMKLDLTPPEMPRKLGRTYGLSAGSDTAIFLVWRKRKTVFYKKKQLFFDFYIKERV